MGCNRSMMLLYAVTDRGWTGRMSLYEQVEAALKNGVTCVQLREKGLEREAFLREALEMGTLCSRYGVPFIVNDDVDIASASGADGVHVGLEDMSVAEVRKRLGATAIIGASAHSVEEAVEAVAQGADYLGVGAVFGSATKTNVTAMPYETLREICSAVDVPVVAIGGIHGGNIGQLKGSGVDGVAVVSAIFGAEDPGKATAELRRLAEDMVGWKE